MALQHVASTPRPQLVGARRLQRIAAIAIAFAIEAILIAAVVLSTIGVSPAWHPTPGGASMGQIPAPTASGERR
jgi:hypothetical protein